MHDGNVLPYPPHGRKMHDAPSNGPIHGKMDDGNGSNGPNSWKK